MKEIIKKSFISALVFGITLIGIGISYSAWLNISSVSSGQSLTSTLMNNIISNVEYNNSQLIGVNQTRQDVTIDRNDNVIYTNNTGKPIVVYISKANNLPSDGYVRVYLDEIHLGNHYGSYEYPITFIVPNGSTYRVKYTGASIRFWSELR